LTAKNNVKKFNLFQFSGIFMPPGRLVCIQENIYKLRQEDRVIGCYLYDEFGDAVMRCPESRR